MNFSESYNQKRPERKFRVVSNPKYAWWKPWQAKEIGEWYETGRMVSAGQLLEENLSKNNPLMEYLQRKRSS